ncbi:IST1-like protein [Dichanthelium oligosanthes]|uniref:IST1-like protein n=1 Tax=Dichanthelium oligosanthes TaxID=888268 RepID=A0A1E5V7U7_9POAL|nr:IST1-like protein [Dichanthelium oligosanthes]
MHKSKGKLSGVLHKGFKPDKCKTSLRMAVARIKLLRNRKEVQVRQMRREVSQLLEANQDMTARIRVEHVIREEKMMQAYDLIEVYCELIVARLSIIDSQKTCPIDLKEAIASVIFASMRCSDVTELADVRKHFTSKYGKEFAAAALEVRPDSGVNRLVIEKLSAGAPDVQTKIKTLSSIAEEHNIKWEPKAFEEKLQKPNEDHLYGPATYSGGNISTMGSSTSSMSTPQPTHSGVPAATVDSATSHVPVEPYSRAGVSANGNSNAFSQENIQNGSSASVPPSSQHGASAYYSAQIPDPNSTSHGNTGAPPYTQYGTTVPDTVSRNEEMNQHRERKPSVRGANWNMEFKDATSAAQAAAESAEMASIAARAAAQLASRGNYSGDQSTGAYEAAAYSHESTPRKQPAEHSVKDERRSFYDQSSDINDPRAMPYARKSSGRAETNRVESHNISTVHAPAQSHNISTVHAPAQQFHSYSPESNVYEMPAEPPRAHSPEPPHFDDLYERESNTGRSEAHPFDFPGEELQETGPGGRNGKDVEVRKPSFDQESTNDFYGNFSSSQDKFTHGSSSVWDKQNGKTQGSSSVVFDQYDSDVEEENLFDTFSSKHTEQLPGVQDHMGFTTADWSQQHRSESPNHRTSMLFSRTDTQQSDNLGANRRDVPSPQPYDNYPPTFDSDGGSSDEKIATTTRTESLKSSSSGLNKEDNRSSGKVVSDVKESIEDYESSSSKKYMTPGLNLSYKEQHGRGTGGSPVSAGTLAQRHLKRVQSRDSVLSDEETEPDKFKNVFSPRSNENQSLPFAIQTSVTSDDTEDDRGLNLGRLTPGLRNKPRQLPPYTKNSRENILPSQSLPKASASTEETVDSEENTTPFEQNRSSPKSSLSTRTSSDGNYNSELYDRNQIVGPRGEARSTMARNFFGSDDTEKLSEQSDNPSPRTTKSSERVNQELYHEKTGIGARREMRSRMARNYFDSDDSEEELEQQQTPQPKRSGVQIQSRRTRDVTSDTKRDGHIRTEARYADETESLPKETKVPQLNNSSTEQRRVAPVYPRVAVQRSSPKDEHVESPMLARGKSQEAEMSRSSVPGNVGNTETSAGTPKESTPQTPPAHVHPKLPDYDSFAAHFMSLRTNRR